MTAPPLSPVLVTISLLHHLSRAVLITEANLAFGESNGTHSSALAGKSHGRRSLEGTVHGVAEGRTRLRDFNFTFHFHVLEKEMATHSSVLVWKIPGTEEPVSYLPWGCKESEATEHTLVSLVSLYLLSTYCTQGVG